MDTPAQSAADALEPRYTLGPHATCLREARVIGPRAVHLLRVEQGAGEFRDPGLDELRIGLVVQGRGWNTFDLGSGRWRGRVGPGVLSVAAPGAPLAVHQDQALELLLCSIPGATLRGVLEPVAPSLVAQVERLHGGPFVDELVRSLVTRMWAQAPHDDATTRLWVDGAITTVAATLLQRALPAAPGRGPRLSTRQVRAVVALLHDRIADDLSLDDLARVAGLSVFHFARAFKATVGVAPHRYLQELRLDRAAAMLRGTNLPVIDVAHAVGFASSQAFARAFRRAFDATPTSYRSRANN